MMAKALIYASHAVGNLPNFYVTRSIVRFRGTPLKISDEFHETAFPELPTDKHKRLERLAASSSVVLFRDGLETYADPGQAMKTECSLRSEAQPIGTESGEVLSLLPQIAARGEEVWSHWEQGPTGALAAFHYSATFDYKFPPRMCPRMIPAHPVSQIRFDGEIAFAPEDGTIYRVTQNHHFMDDSIFGNPRQADDYRMMMYGPVEIGGIQYISAVKGVVMGIELLATPLRDLNWLVKRFGLSQLPTYETLDDETFTDYHVFRAQSRIPGSVTPDAPAAHP